MASGVYCLQILKFIIPVVANELRVLLYFVINGVVLPPMYACQNVETAKRHIDW